jgi:hypothetical protein
MAAPNMINVTAITGKTAFLALTTVTANVITNSGASGTAVKLNNVVLTNYSTSPVTANVLVNRSATVYYLAGSMAIPANSTLVLLGKDTSFYLEEGDVIQANTSANASVTFAGSYEIIS